MRSGSRVKAGGRLRLSPRFRFWVYLHGSPARVSLSAARPVVETVEGGPHEEGHTWQVTTYRLEGDVVRVEYDESGRDCDGRFSFHSKSECRVDRLDTGHTVESFTFPAWRPIASSQRDFSAEAAGY